jgi:DNA-binding NtrC family response regulator
VQIALDLVRHFNRELNKKFSGFTPGAAELLQNHSWPGNNRELKNVIERTMILATQGDIDAAELPEEVRNHARGGSKDRNSEDATALEASPNGRPLISLRELEDDYIQEVLVTTGNNKTQAARILGIHPTSLLRRLKKEQ